MRADETTYLTTTTNETHRTPAEPAGQHTAMTWAQRFKRVFNIDIKTCQACGGTMKVLACIEDPIIIRKILYHLDRTEPNIGINSLPEPWAPPQAGLFETLWPPCFPHADASLESCFRSCHNSFAEMPSSAGTWADTNTASSGRKQTENALLIIGNFVINILLGTIIQP